MGGLMRDFADEQVAFAAVKGPLALEDLLFQAKKANRIAPLQLVRADRIVGPDHIRAAAMHAHRAFAEGRNQADRLEVEFVRYLAGRRTIRDALEHMGLPDPVEDIAVVALGEHRTEAVAYFTDMLGFHDQDDLVQATEATLRAFGVEASDATRPDLHLDLVLEAVASVDVMRT